MLGDFNSQSKLWGCSGTNDKGVIIENFIAENYLCLFNNKQATYLHSPTRKYFSIDPAICSPNIYLDFNWSVLDDLHGSDHFPFVIRENIEIFTKTLIDIAEKCIPKTSTNYKRNKPWFNDEVKTAIKEKIGSRHI